MEGHTESTSPVEEVIIHPDSSAFYMAHMRPDKDHIMEWMDQHSQRKSSWELGTPSRERERRMGPPEGRP